MSESGRPLVSVLMPARNAGAWIRASIDSVLRQSWRPLELIVVDDASTDDTAAIVRSYARDEVRLITLPEPVGSARARNIAFAASHGALVKYFDADDVLSDDCIELQVARLGERDDAIASSEWGRFYGNDHGATRFDAEPVWRDLPPVEWLTTAFDDAHPMMQCGMFLIPRAIIERSGGWDESLSLIDDFEFFTRIMLAAREIRFTPGARLHYRSGIGGLSGAQSRQAVESAFKSLNLGVEHLLATEQSGRTRRAAASVLQGFVFRYYPDHADLCARMEERVRTLGGATVTPDGPPGFQLLRRIVGWRAARRIELMARRHGLTRSQRQAARAV